MWFCCRQASEESKISAASALAKLATCVVAYCWRELKPEHWADLLVRAKEGVAAVAVIMEEQVRPWGHLLHPNRARMMYFPGP